MLFSSCRALRSVRSRARKLFFESLRVSVALLSKSDFFLYFDLNDLPVVNHYGQLSELQRSELIRNFFQNILRKRFHRKEISINNETNSQVKMQISTVRVSFFSQGFT